MASTSSTQKTQITVSGGASKGKSKKSGGAKKPGRGMGVAQLERIRVQESWKMINEMNPVHTQTAFLHGTPVCSFPNPDPGSWSHFEFNNFAFKKKRVMNGEDFEPKCYQGVEILAVHRKGVGTRNMVMEYGFFPANSPATARPAATSPSVNQTNSSIDLSLKL